MVRIGSFSNTKAEIIYGKYYLINYTFCPKNKTAFSEFDFCLATNGEKNACQYDLPEMIPVSLSMVQQHV
jgi:hypothetical protein